MTNPWKIGLIGLGSAFLLTAPIGVASAQSGGASVGSRAGMVGGGLTGQNQRRTGLPSLSGTGNMDITLEPTTKSLPKYTIKELEAPAVTAIPPAAVAKPATCYYVDQNGVRHNMRCPQ